MDLPGGHSWNIYETPLDPRAVAIARMDIDIYSLQMSFLCLEEEPHCTAPFISVYSV